MLKEKRNNFQRKKCQKISCHVSIHPTDHLLSKAEHTTSATNAIATVNANQLSFFTHPFTSRTRAVVFSLPLYFRLHITRQFTTNMSNPAHVCSSAGGLPKEAITCLVCHLPANLSPRPQAEGKPSWKSHLLPTSPPNDLPRRQKWCKRPGRQANNGPTSTALCKLSPAAAL